MLDRVGGAVMRLGLAQMKQLGSRIATLGVAASLLSGPGGMAARARRTFLGLACENLEGQQFAGPFKQGINAPRPRAGAQLRR